MLATHAPSEAFHQSLPAAEQPVVPVIPGPEDRRLAARAAATYVTPLEAVTTPPALPEHPPRIPLPKRILHLGHAALGKRTVTLEQPPRYTRAMALLKELETQEQQIVPIVDPADRTRPIIGYRAQGLEPLGADEVGRKRETVARQGEVPAWAMHGNGEWQQYSADPRKGQ